MIDLPIEISLSAATTIVVLAFAAILVCSYFAAERARDRRRRKAGASVDPRAPYWTFSHLLVTSLYAGVGFALLSGLGSIVLFFEDAFVFAADCDVVDIVETEETAGDTGRIMVVEIEPTNSSVMMNITVWTRPPFEFHICRPSDAWLGARLAEARLTRISDTGTSEVWSKSGFGDGWRRFGDHECLVDVLTLDMPVAPRRRFCMDLGIDIGQRRKAERTCWDFIHVVRTDRLSLRDIVDG